ncbi:B9 domain-containing protein 2 [Orchesella cincta]|uniref:B9 domain-containing protein 2 n=1 Tax=Orchesella cincta TaxID=48709 RepID=A0A1D2NCK2_ORCCI|nr:B9 domain-containing protein 2 [Orchesella cincta]
MQIHSIGSNWKRVAGPKEGQTQVDTPKYSDTAQWAHPIDLHFVTKGLQGWPKLILEVYRQDEFGRSDLSGYGVCHIPATPGNHIIEVPTWRPAGSTREEVVRHFVGGSAELSEPDLIVNPTERYRLRTVPSGTATVELSVILRNFDKFGVET